jgi:hypothetical protein
MRTVTIPFNYFDLPYSEQQKITPICIPACDKNGTRIAWGWFEAASRVEERLRSMTRRILHDERLVSEVAEGGVHNSWQAHGDNLSRSPEGLVVRNAGWHALNMKAGGRRERSGKVVALEDLSVYFHETLRRDPTDYAAEYNSKIDFDLLADELAAEGYGDMSQILDLMQDGKSWNDIAAELGEKPDAVRKRIRRWLSKRSDLAERILLAVTDGRRKP